MQLLRRPRRPALVTFPKNTTLDEIWGVNLSSFLDNDDSAWILAVIEGQASPKASAFTCGEGRQERTCFFGTWDFVPWASTQNIISIN